MGVVSHRVRSGAASFVALAAFASPASAEHVMQSVALNSPDGGFVHAASFVRNDERLYLAGGFFGQVDFNPNGAPSLHTSTCPTTYGCSFVAQYDETMQLAWLDVFHGTGDAADQRLVARTGGGVYLLLDFSADLAYRPNETEPVYHAVGVNDIAVVALDGDGNFAGSAQFGIGGWNVLPNSRPFEAAPGIVDVAWTHQDVPITGNGINAYASRADTLTGVVSGAVIGITATDPSGFADIRDQRPDATGRYVCGLFSGTVDFDALHAHRIETSTQAAFEAFIGRYDVNGALVWLSTVSTDMLAECYGLAIATDGTLWAAGDFGGSAEIHYEGSPVAAELTSWGSIDLLLLAYDSDGALLSNAHLGGPGAQVYLERIEASADGSLSLVGEFGGTILHGFAGAMMAQSTNDYRDAFMLVAAPDLTTRYFGHIGYDDGYTFADTLQLAGPMQIETIAQMDAPTGGNAMLDYALPPEHALLHNDGTWASAYVRYDLDALLVSGFDAQEP